MAVVRIQKTLPGLIADLDAAPSKVLSKGKKAVQQGIREGNSLARGYARAASGPHGKNYYKRITAEMIGPLEGEYGPHGDVVGNAVGAGWRNGPPNTDLEKSLDVVGPKFADAIHDATEGLL